MMRSVSILLSAIAISFFILAAPVPARGMKDSFPGEIAFLKKLAPEERYSYFAAQYFMNKYQRKAYLSLPTAERRAEWFERFWIDIDPTPATPENERREEHEKRAALARKLFGMTKAPGWDRRGETLIRYGLPNNRTQIWGTVSFSGMTAPGEVWFYESLDMLVQFRNANLKGEYFFASDPVGRSSRRELERNQNISGLIKYGVLTEMFPTQFMSPDEVKDLVDFNPDEIDYTASPDTRMITLKDRIAEMEQEKVQKSVNNFYAALEERPTIYSFELNQKLLPLYFDVASFRGGERTLRTEISFEVPTSELKFVQKEGALVADVEFKVLVRDVDMKEVAFAVDTIKPTVTGDWLTDKGPRPPSLVPAQIVLALEPGYYRVGIEARDRTSERRAAYRTNIELVPYAASPSVSDIQFASSIRETEANQDFVKGGLQVVPHPSHAYRKPFPLWMYFELYGLDTDPEGLAYYRVEYRIIPLEKRRRGPVFEETSAAISSSFETSGYGTTQPQRISVATENLWEGRFRFIVTVTDRRSFRTATRSEDFSILK
ncbi:MAG: GWxTD domain-containing protein [Candidatus Krumholzibacteriia bacterium]